ncbi:caspase-8-like [Manduca sexta]|uniref:Caspase-8 n=1 Tax=Manduca sexta TaxID=7130 RepID=A0A922CJJ7_MANSE|nr:caspase-8-like [Manduca sexta]XP_037295569.1 caspase-8-like [Manduca sexta]XP_037295570.1 caspase-8-like [Manduca sexta]KAG6448307.1 hypothetical protein O3G_MSEX005457 [Manduca sexta]KAG6448308.1 hypothetical protein O3G_MSEX005457 [Manduca sexta]KAG6448309.1 hypothetical protein O3G_MSEX005457 [Manduca sexta]KAG6448310.1 hypothetical protein O3G_MSEX005457 [Manduca sexta]
MLSSDARSSLNSKSDNETFILNLDSISKIEKQLQDNPYDMISLVFLLYDVPDTALQRLMVYQRVTSDVSGTNINLLQEWYCHASSRPDWQHELLEALMICQLNSIVKSLGFHIPTMRVFYQSNDPFSSKYINPVKKVLYHACENINSTNLLKLKKSLLSYDINVMEYTTCELIFLELLSNKFITINNIGQKIKTNQNCICNVENLVKILDNLNGLKKVAMNLRYFQSKFNDEEVDSFASVNGSSSPSLPVPPLDGTKLKQDDKNYGAEDFSELFDIINNMPEPLENNFKSDTMSTKQNRYEIKNPEQLGVCIVINQENFYPSKNSIEDHQIVPLEERKGSSVDKRTLERTMTSLKFQVHSCSDLDHDEMIEFIKKKINKHVTSNDSIFMLCILSHGVRDHVYAADSVKIKVESIQNLLDSDEMSHLRGIPKVFIIQACQVEDTPHPTFAADNVQTNYYLGKLDFLIYWATAPEYEAFRHEQTGSLFIQALCKLLRQRAKHDHLHEIFTQVNNNVTNLCTKLQRAQVPLFKSTLRKNLYLQVPE